MLRPAVAVTNCASASGLVIWRQRLSLKKAPDTVNLRVTGPTRCPGGAGSSTRWRAGLSPGRSEAPSARRRKVPSGLCCSAEQGEVKNFIGREELESPRKPRFLPVYQKPPADITMRARAEH